MEEVKRAQEIESENLKEMEENKLKEFQETDNSDNTDKKLN